MTTRFIDTFYKTAMANRSKIAVLTEKSQLSFDDVLHLVTVLDIGLRSRRVREGDTLVLTTLRGELNIAFLLLLSLRGYRVIFSSLDAVLAAGLEFDWVVTMEPVEGLAAGKQLLVEPDWFDAMGTIPLPDYSAVVCEAQGEVILRTTGTTGLPKFIATDAGEKLAEMRAVSRLSAEEIPGVRVLTSSTCHTAYSMQWNMPVLLGGGSVVALSDHLDRIPQYLDLYNVSHVAVTTSFVKQLFEVEYPQQYLCSLKEIIIGASYSSPALLGKLTGLTRAQIVIDYGSSETGAVAHAPYRPGTDFPAGYLGEFSRPDLDLKFYDEALRELQGVSEGLAGFGFANYPSKRYLLDNTEEKFGFHGNVFIPGDLLRREGNGLYYLGRAQNVVNIGGEKHSLDIIQQVLDHAFPEFLTMAVIARDPQGEECLVVCHTARADLPRDVFREALHQRLEGYIDLVPMRLEAMPLTGTGKIDRRGLVGIAQSRLTPDANQ